MTCLMRRQEKRRRERMDAGRHGCLTERLRRELRNGESALVSTPDQSAIPEVQEVTGEADLEGVEPRNRTKWERAEGISVPAGNIRSHDTASTSGSPRGLRPDRASKHDRAETQGDPPVVLRERTAPSTSLTSEERGGTAGGSRGPP